MVDELGSHKHRGGTFHSLHSSSSCLLVYHPDTELGTRSLSRIKFLIHVTSESVTLVSHLLPCFSDVTFSVIIVLLEVLLSISTSLCSSISQLSDSRGIFGY